VIWNVHLRPLAPSPVAQIVKYPSSSVLINTPGVASIAAGHRDGHLKLALTAIGDARRRGWCQAASRR